jgi:hypothetical protein
MIRHLTSLLFPVNAALSFALLISFSLFLPLESFAIISFATAIGNYFAIIVNFGQDQTQISGLLQGQSSQDRRRHFLYRQTQSFIIFLALVSSYFLIETALSYSFHDTMIGGAALAWAAMIGLFPNAYVDFLGRLVQQQLLISVERLLALGIILLSFSLYGSSGLEIMLVALLALRLINIGFQYAFCIFIDSQNTSTPNETALLRTANNDGSTLITIAQLLNSLGLYGALFLFRELATVSDVAIVSFGIQCFSFATLIPAIYIRRNLREFANADVNSGHAQTAMILSQARSLVRVALFTGSIAIIIIWVWLLIAMSWEVNFTHFVTGFIIGLWSVAVSYGMRLSRAIIHKRKISFYIRWSLIYSSVSLALSYLLGREFGAVGFMAGVVFPHILVILRYHFFIYREMEAAR